MYRLKLKSAPAVTGWKRIREWESPKFQDTSPKFQVPRKNKKDTKGNTRINGFFLGLWA